MQVAFARTLQPRPSARKPNLVVLHEGIRKADVDTLRTMVRTLSEKCSVSMKARCGNPTLIKEDEQWVFKVRGAAKKELPGLNRQLKATPLRRRSEITRLNEEISLKEESIT